MLIMGSMIGSGIFIVPAKMSAELGSPAMLIAAWAVTAVLTVFAALSYGELAAMMPKAGGQYVYLKEAYGRLPGFLYGWTFFAVIQTGTIAAVAVAFSVYSGVFFREINDVPLAEAGGVVLTTRKALAVCIVWILTIVNFRGIRSGAIVQNLFTFAKIGSLLFMIMAGLYFISNHPPVPVNWQLPGTFATADYLGLFCAALVGSIFSSDAWNNVTFTGSEIENPRRNLPYSLLIGTSSVLLLYILINWIYIYALPFDEIRAAEDGRVGTLLLSRVLGQAGALVMAALIMISTFGCINGLTLSGARVYFAMARDGLFFKKAGELNSHKAPRYALMIQAVWTSVLTMSGGYNDLLDYVVIAVLLFYVLTVVAVFVLRIRKPDAERPYKVWGYPLVPLLYTAMATYICINLLIYRSNTTWPGIAIVLAGIPVFYLLARKPAARS